MSEQNRSTDDQEGENAYDFKKFITHLKNPSCEPIIKFTKSFIHNFLNSEKLYTLKEQVRLISDFEAFIFERFNMFEPFKSMSDEQIRNSKDCMEKLITSKIYPRIFSPLIAEANGIENLDEEHKTNVKNDIALEEKIVLYSFLKPENFELAPGDVLINKFSHMAIKQFSKLNDFKAPRDKMICILNSCKILFAYLKKKGSHASTADDFIPLLIYTIIHSGSVQGHEIKSLASNCSYIEHFRRSDFLTGENRYYLSSLQGVLQYILEMDVSSLKIEDDAREAFEEALANSKAALSKKKESETTAASAESKTGKEALANSAYDMGVFSGLFSNFLGSTDDTAKEAVATTAAKRKTADKAGDDERYVDAVKKMEQEERRTTLNNLTEMFPELDQELIKDICIIKKYHTSDCIDTLLELSV